MSLRSRLLLLSLLTLGLPWAGCQYAREMERALRVGQEAALLSTARSLSRVVAADPEALYRDPAMRTTFDPARGDLFAPRLPARPLLDAYADEWPAALASNPLRAGVVARTLYLYAELAVPRAGSANGRSTSTPSGSLRIVVLTRDRDGNERAWAMAANGDGPILAQPTTVGAPWEARNDAETRLSGMLRGTTDGFAVELRMPLRLVGDRLAVFAVDPAGRLSAGSARLGWLHTASESLSEKLGTFASRQMRLSVVDSHGWLLARAGSLAPDPDAHLRELRTEQGLRQAVYRRLLDRPELPAPPYRVPLAIVGEPVDTALSGHDAAVWMAAAYGDPAIVRAAAPLESAGALLGALVVEQPAERVLILRDAALARLLDVTLGVGIVTVLAVTLFAAWLGFRLRRLSRAAGTALTPEGRLAADLPERSAGDELGDLARSFDALLARLEEQNAYLRSLASKLSHELRTPLAIVSSSLDNLDDPRFDHDHRVYLARAREGASRLHRILNAMSEATRLEQSIDQTERVSFDLAQLVRDVGAAYQASFGADRIQLDVSNGPCAMMGSPELIAQMLDKLVENAQDFCPPGGHIVIGLDDVGARWRLFVSNEGPPLAAEIAHRLFDSMTAARPTRSDVPHLGLGLYVAKLIAQFHGARIAARNRPDGSGVIVEIEWPAPRHEVALAQRELP